MSEPEKKPKQYLMEMGIGPDNATLIPPGMANTYRTTASMLKMQGMKFKTRAIAPGADDRWPGLSGLVITRVK